MKVAVKTSLSNIANNEINNKGVSKVKPITQHPLIKPTLCDIRDLVLQVNFVDLWLKI